MKTLILATLISITALQAENIVHYDKKEVKSSSMSKPNHPNTGLYKWEFDLINK